nr:flagellar biosynthetic protein FliO [Burkholderia sp. WAC0059]
MLRAAPVLALAAPLAARAADLQAVNRAVRSASDVAVGSAVPALGVGAVMQTIFGLAIVLGLVFGCAWLARRLGLQPAQRGGLVRTIGGASLGGKERVAVVEVGDTWLVLGAAPGNVRLLHTMPAGELPGGAGTPSSPDSRTDGAGSFARRFRDALGSEARRRLGRREGGEQ